MNAFEVAQKDGKVEKLHRQLVELENAQNKSTDGSTYIEATFLRMRVSLCCLFCSAYPSLVSPAI